MEGRKVYDNSGQLMEHFDFIPQEVKNQFPRGFPHSLANVLRLRRPLVIVDEAHNARSPLSMEVLDRFQPRAIVEFTATPETEDNPSNVLHSVSAQQLKAENMIKPPIVLEAPTGFKEVMASAIAMRGELEKEAEQERKATGEYIRPILLLQAEPHDKDRPDALTVEVLEKALREEHFIPDEQIAVATGSERGLEGVDLNKEDCPIRYVITQSAHKEGLGLSVRLRALLGGESELRNGGGTNSRTHPANAESRTEATETAEPRLCVCALAAFLRGGGDTARPVGEERGLREARGA
jgi:type III restriction enzyme